MHVSSDRNLVDVRFPVQYVIRPQSSAFPDYRGYAGTVASGVLKPGDEIMVLPKIETKSVEITRGITQIIYQIAVAAKVLFGL